MKNMTKADLVRLAQPPHLTREDTLYVVNGALNAIESHLQTEGHSISLRGIGTLITVRQAARRRRIPDTGKLVHNPAKLRVRFITSPILFHK